MPLSNCEFRANRFSQSHTLFLHVNEKLATIFYTCHLIRIRFGTENVDKNLSGCEFRENGRSKSYTLLRRVNEFLSILYTFMFLLKRE
jgi:hypothetical protein